MAIDIESGKETICRFRIAGGPPSFVVIASNESGGVGFVGSSA